MTKTKRWESMFYTVSHDHIPRGLPPYIGQMSGGFLEADGFRSAYEGAILGAADARFGLQALDRALHRESCRERQMAVLLPLTRLCLGVAACHAVSGERPGLPTLWKLAARETLQEEQQRLTHTPWGRLEKAWLQTQALGEEADPFLEQEFGAAALAQFYRLLWEGACAQNAEALVAQSVCLYQAMFPKGFAGGIPLPKQKQPTQNEDPGEQLLPEQEAVLAYGTPHGRLSDEAISRAAAPQHLEKLFGPSCVSQKRLSQLENRLCTGVHERRKLHITDGPRPEAAGEGAREFALARQQNNSLLQQQASALHQGIEKIQQAFQRAFDAAYDPDSFLSDHGVPVNRRLWQIGRSERPLVFENRQQTEPETLAVDLLLDASGSQKCRQSLVAMQGYLFSRALSNLKIPHRVSGFCAYGPYTVMRRFRDFDEPAVRDEAILEFRGNANNRDGLAIALCAESLAKRQEARRILIVFSDGLPNDMAKVGPDLRKERVYAGAYAVEDTCRAVRMAKRGNVSVIGIFLGNDAELENERLIYGTSFVRIQQPDDFAGAAGRSLCRSLLGC